MTEPNSPDPRNSADRQDVTELQRNTAPDATDSPGTADSDDAVEGELSDHRAAVLHHLLRVAYPHPSFPDGPYQRTAAAIQQTDGSADVLTAGLDDLDSRAGGDFTALAPEDATAVIQQIETTSFFRLVHSTTVVALYDDHEVWQLLGYEGASFDKGGYLHRGFDDLEWLPAPRIEEYSGEPRPELVTPAVFTSLAASGESA